MPLFSKKNSFDVLIVDDSMTMRKIIRRCLEQTGLKLGQVDEAPDGKVALDHFDQHNYNFIITDWNMPEMDGLEFVRRVRKKDADIKILMVTTETGLLEIEEAFNEKVTDYIMKPFKAEKLREKMVALTEDDDELED